MSVIEKRWEAGLDHHPLSEAIFELLATVDVDDYFEWKAGGDGDNGEALMYLIDHHLDSHDPRFKCRVCNMLTEGVKNPLNPPTDARKQLDVLGFGNIQDVERSGVPGWVGYTRDPDVALAAMEWGWSVTRTVGGQYEASKTVEE